MNFASSRVATGKIHSELLARRFAHAVPQPRACGLMKLHVNPMLRCLAEIHFYEDNEILAFRGCRRIREPLSTAGSMVSAGRDRWPGFRVGKRSDRAGRPSLFVIAAELAEEAMAHEMRDCGRGRANAG
jgi:hypothetical protein